MARVGWIKRSESTFFIYKKLGMHIGYVRELKMRIKFFKSKIDKVKSEKGFTFVELIFVTVVIGTLSSSLMLPLLNSIKQGTRPEIYATATYLAEKEIEELKNAGYTIVADPDAVPSNMGDVSSSVTFYPGTPREITYTEKSVREYVRRVGSNFVDPDPLFPITEYIRVTETVTNTKNSAVVSLWTILAKGFYDPVVNPP
jgi:type II secretory pathway pseudopilin PulG